MVTLARSRAAHLGTRAAGQLRNHPWRSGAYLLTVAGSAGLGFALPSALPAVAQAVLGALSGLALVGSDLLYRRLRGPLGRMTAFASVCLVWAALWLTMAVASDSCLTAGRTARCAPRELATYTLVGLLLPLVVPAFTVGPWLTFRAGRALVRRSRRGHGRLRGRHATGR